MRPYPFRLLRVGVLAAAGVVLLLTVLLNALIPPMKTELVQAVNRHFSQRIEVTRVFFLPPSYVIFRDIAVYETGDPEPVFVIPHVRAHLSLVELLAHRRLSVSRVDCHGFASSDIRFALFVRNNYRQIVEFIKSLPAQDIRIVINDAALESVDEKHARRHYASMDAAIDVGAGVIAVEGVVRTREVYQRSRRSVSAVPAAFRLRLRMTDRGCAFDNAEVSRSNCYLKAWGVLDAGQMNCDGFAFVNTSYHEEEYRESASDTRRGFSLVRIPRFRSVPALSMGDADLLLLDVHASCAFALPRVDITTLSLEVNNVPVTLKGSVVFGTPASVDLRVTALPSSAQAGAALRGIKKVDASVKGYLQNAVFKGAGRINLLLSRDEKSNNPLDRVDIAVRQAEVFLGGGKQLVHLGGVTVQCQSPSTPYAVTLDRSVAVIRHLHTKLFEIRLNALLCDGRMRAKASLDLSCLPPRVVSTMLLKDLDTQKLDQVLIHFSKVYGRMYGEMRFSSWPKPVLEGNVSIRQGALRDFEFFQWLSEQFALPSLRTISFARTKLAFTVERQGARMHLISLVSPDALLNGYFQLDNKNFVSSKISLALGSEMLKESRKGKGLSTILQDGAAYLHLDFQLSGPLQSMNFQWLESDAKRRLQQSIPGFIERKLEKNVEHMLSP